MLDPVTTMVFAIFANVQHFFEERFARSDIPPIVLVGVLYGVVVNGLSILFRYFIWAKRDWGLVAPYATFGGVTFHVIIGMALTSAIALLQAMPGDLRKTLKSRSADSYPLIVVTMMALVSLPDYVRIFGDVAKAALFASILPLNALWVSPLLRWGRLKMLDANST